MASRGLVVALLAACTSSPMEPTPDLGPPCTPPAATTAPTFAQLYERYFAAGTPGHCATAGCHADPRHVVWLCGDDKDRCYAGMVSIELVDPIHGDHSMIGDPDRSPLTWIDPHGNMPFDATGSFPEGRDAILAWVGACAQND